MGSSSSAACNNVITRVYATALPSGVDFSPNKMSLLDLQSHRTQLLLTAIGTAAATASIFSLYNTTSRRRKRRELDDDIRRSLSSSAAVAGQSHTPVPQEFAQGKRRHITGDGLEESEISIGGAGAYEYDEELVREQLARNYAFFGDEGMSKIRKGSVVVVGCGGVGSWAAVMLVRSCVRSVFSSQFTDSSSI